MRRLDRSLMVKGPRSFVANPYFAQVKLLLHGEGANGGVIITDSSSANRTATIVGTVTTSTTNPAIGSASLNFVQSSRLSFPQDTAFDLLSNDFTFEFWFNLNTLPTTSTPQTFISKWLGTGNGLHSYRCDMVTNGTTQTVSFRYTVLDVETPITFDLTSVASIVTGTWYSIAFVRTGGTLLAFLNGFPMTPTTSATMNVALQSISADLSIGAIVSSGTTVNGVSGNMDELRMTIGTALYTVAYTPASTAFSDF